MRVAAVGAFAVVALLSAVGVRGGAQDTVAVRRAWAIDSAKLRPFHHSYDMLVQFGDSMQLIGQRDVSFGPAMYAGAPGWALVETRTGVVPAVETLYVSSALKPLLLSSALGAAKLAIGFPGDSLYGASGGPGGRHNVVLAGAPRLVASSAMVEALLPLLPLAPSWADSVSVLLVNQASSSVVPAELAVIGEEYAARDSSRSSVWVVALRGHALGVLFWVDKASGAVTRQQQPLPLHGAALLEYRRRSGASDPAAPPPEQDAGQ